MNKFKLKTELRPKGDQPTAIKKITGNIGIHEEEMVLLGVTGSGKTFTMAKTVEKLNKPTLVITHNKTLAAQLYSEFKEFFPDNAIHYFVSYYDYYQPEAYIPRTDTYIEKDADVNEEIDRLRNAATASLFSRPDTLIVASVSCIYGLGSPDLYRDYKIDLAPTSKISREKLQRRLIDIHYARNDKVLERGNFRVRGEILDIVPAYSEVAYRIEFLGDEVEKIKEFNYLTGEVIKEIPSLSIYPAKHFLTVKDRIGEMKEMILAELKERLKYFKKEGKLLEAQRLEERVRHDLEMIEETGYVGGIENYARYLAFREPGEAPSTLLDYFPDDFLCLIDESHMTIPQIRGMYNGDRSRKETLVEFGFRLPSALDNRPLKFQEFKERTGKTLYVSATPGEYELSRVTESRVKSPSEFYKKREKGQEFPAVAEQIIRPTGLLDPVIEVRPEKDQIPNLLGEIKTRVKKDQRVLVTTLTKKMAEDLSEYLSELKIKVQYLHSEVATLDRPEILRDLRLGKYDVVVGVNLLREGLDLPEVSLVAILDADKEGFLRGETALIQTIGRAARHEEGKVIMYASRETRAMKIAISETERRRKIQEKYNKEHGITPAGIKKAIRDSMKEDKGIDDVELKGIEIKKIPESEIKVIIKDLENKMEIASKALEFEKAAEYRDLLSEIREEEEKKSLKKRL
ncbi:MAG: excinuclease ABC subunit UvrB [Patescibacteria group bacterium]|nr:excinuclease ABC subunit UvrB [Patescibacteria group bacterium]